MMSKTFKLEEANMLLPILESLLKQGMDAKQTIEAVDEEFQELQGRIFVNGGTRVNIVHYAKRKAAREKAIQRIKDSVAEIHATGVQVKDLDVGLLDFPCMVDGETVLLCWKYGEEHRIGHWHGLEEGFAGRKPISELNLEPKKDQKDNKDPERPN
jgi:hypothetical protein